MVRKIIIVASLALLLIGIAYVRALFSHQDRQMALSPEVTKSVPSEILDGYLKQEEAAAALDSIHKFYLDSLATLNALWTDTANNLPQVNLDSLQEIIGQLQQKLSQSEEDIEKAWQSKNDQYKRLIAAFYKGEVLQLPADLSSYEREVSIKEIKEKARKYFAISADSLDDIISQYR